MGTPLFVGIDVSKATLDVAVLPKGKAWTSPNDPDGVAGREVRVAVLGPALVVLEATGRYEAPCAAALASAGIAVAVVNPRQVRDFAKSTGRLSPAPCSSIPRPWSPTARRGDRCRGGFRRTAYPDRSCSTASMTLEGAMLKPSASLNRVEIVGCRRPVSIFAMKERATPLSAARSSWLIRLSSRRRRSTAPNALGTVEEGRSDGSWAGTAWDTR